MGSLSFRAQIRNHGGNSWHYLIVPREASDRLGTRARVPIRGTVNGVEFRNSLLPDGKGGFTLVVNGELRSAASVQKGDWVKVDADVDTAPRIVRVPPDLRAALTKSPAAREFFRTLSYSHQKEYVDWLTGAKRPETRIRRVRGMVEKLSRERFLDD